MTTSVFSSHPTPHPTEFFKPEDWHNFGTALAKNRETEWSQVKEGSEFDLLGCRQAFDFFPRVYANVARKNNGVIYSEAWYLLPPNNSGQLRYVIAAWSAEEGAHAPELRTAWLGEPEANAFFKHFCSERGLPVNGCETLGYLVIYRANSVIHYQYSRAMGKQVG